MKIKAWGITVFDKLESKFSNMIEIYTTKKSATDHLKNALVPSLIKLGRIKVIPVTIEYVPPNK